MKLVIREVLLLSNKRKTVRESSIGTKTWKDEEVQEFVTENEKSHITYTVKEERRG